MRTFFSSGMRGLRASAEGAIGGLPRTKVHVLPILSERLPERVARLALQAHHRFPLDARCAPPDFDAVHEARLIDTVVGGILDPAVREGLARARMIVREQQDAVHDPLPCRRRRVAPGDRDLMLEDVVETR